MDPERKQWLQQALEGMTVDFIEQLANGIKILTSSTTDLELKEDTLDRLEDWLGNIDTANNFHKIGGFKALLHCLQSNHPSLRTGAAHLIAEICQNNEYCQQHLVKDGFLEVLSQQLDRDEDTACRVKALYAISCIVRDFKPGMAAFAALEGWSTVLRAIQSDSPKLRTKGCFFLASVASIDPSLVEELSGMGLVLQLGAILQGEDVELTHEHVLHALLTLVKQSEIARRDAASPHLNLEQILRSRREEWAGRGEYQESLDHCTNLLNICFNHEENLER